MKLLLVGIDALDAKAYQVYGKRHPCRPLRSPTPYTGPAWTTIYTGLPADVHGVKDPWGQATEFAVPAKAFAERCMWALLPSELKAGIWNMPVAYPSSGLEFYVAGFPYLPEMRELSFPQPDSLYWDLVWWPEEANKEGTEWHSLDILAAIARIREERLGLADVFIQQCKATPVDFAAIGFRFPDRLGHIYGSNKWLWAEVERLSIELADLLLDELLGTLQPDAWMVVSDHGIERTEHRDLGVLLMGGLLQDKIMSRRWWSTKNPIETIGEYLGFTPENVPEAVREQRLASAGAGPAVEKVQKALRDGTPLRLNLGCGSEETQQKGDEWLNIDIVPHEGLDLLFDLYNGLPFPDEFVDEIRALDVLEHLSYRVAGYILGEWCRVLKPGGTLELRSPDVGKVAKAYAAGKVSHLALLQACYGRACSLDWDTHIFGLDLGWLKGQLHYWGCPDIEILADPDPYTLHIRATKQELPEESKNDTYALEERVQLGERLEALGYC